MSEQRIAGRELDAEIATKVMGLSLDMPRERALAIVGVTFVRVTGRVFLVDYGDGDETLIMPRADDLPGHQSDDNYNQRYFRYVADKGIEHGGKRAAMIEKRIAECHLPVEKFSTNATAALRVVDQVLSEFAYCFEAFASHESGGWKCAFNFGAHDATADTLPLAICLAALKVLDKPTEPESPGTTQTPSSPNSNPSFVAVSRAEDRTT